MRSISIIRQACPAILLSMVACSGDATGDAARVVTRDSAGITIVENPSPADSARLPWWRVEEPEIDIGGINAEDAYAVYRVTGALRLSDDRIAVASSGTDDIRIFDPAGTWISTSGRSGEGPGEYQNVTSLVLGAADSLLVVDGMARRVSVLAPDGEFVRTFAVGDVSFVPRIVGRFPDGSLLAAPALILGPEDLMDTDGISRPPFVLIRVPPDGEAMDTLGEFPGAERVIRIQTSGGEVTTVSIRSVSFGRSSTFAVHDSVVYIGAQDAPEIPVYGEDGQLRRIIRTGLPPEPVTERHLQAEFERQVEALPEEQQAQFRAQARDNETPHNDFVPPYGEIRTDRVGNLWVSDYDDPTDPPNRWTVYDPTGAILARIALPERFRPFDIGEDWVLGRWTDDYDVEHVQLRHLVRSTP